MQLEELLEKHGVRHAKANTHRHVRSGWVGVDCPWCGSIDKFHLGINLKSFACVCWKCGTHSLPSVLIEVVRCTAAEGYQVATQLRGTAQDIAPQIKIKGRLQFPSGIEDLGKQHKAYLRQRGFNWQQIVRLWGVRGFGINSSRYKWRLFIPVLLRGQTVSWTTRTIGTQLNSKYLNSPPEMESVPIKHVLYGIDYATTTILLHEGPTDVWNVGPGAVASFGLNVSPVQMKALIRFPVRYVCFDNSDDAQQRGRRLADVLSVFPGETYNVELDSSDPGSAPKSEIKKLRKAVFGNV